MTTVIQMPHAERATSSVIALHCSLGSGRQWSKLAIELGGRYQIITPDISGYGDSRGPATLPSTLAQEVELLAARLDEARGPIHLIGHSYGGAVAFKIATCSPYARRVRSLTLIEPVLPTLLRDVAADRRLHDRFEHLMQEVCEDMFNGLAMEAIDKFTAFWNGSGPPAQLSDDARLHLIAHADKLPFEFTSLFAEADIAAAAATLRVPTLLVSGGLSPYLTQRVVGRLMTIIGGAEIRHLTGAGHMLPITHAATINPEIVAHIAQAEQGAGMSLAAG
ncbi:alpha/beta fold hydrolase [Bradyrhizobium sp. Ash2021]|uniref:alpha/beta fold hydrolase n=1 Tax=Bradyrhizobium sp. Ash2021 TaxID=2954771 RepID=UPI0028161768|nr:alpha/beta fold hydrolase [Bradyrhizobium sp. Ash2021]WMT75355.1 alpha/beta hydrolase [Bradyrhizobium sp. Ash2021]